MNGKCGADGRDPNQHMYIQWNALRLTPVAKAAAEQSNQVLSQRARVSSLPPLFSPENKEGKTKLHQHTAVQFTQGEHTPSLAPVQILTRAGSITAFKHPLAIQGGGRCQQNDRDGIAVCERKNGKGGWLISEGQAHLLLEEQHACLGQEERRISWARALCDTLGC